MLEERILALDVSTKTGYASTVSNKDGIFLEHCGTLDQIHMPKSPYPGSFVDWAHQCFEKIIELIDRFAPDVLVIEETSAGSKAIYTQKILEYTHYLLAKFIKESNIKSVYLLTEQWRRETGCLMSKEESKRNKYVRDYKKKSGNKIAYDTNGKRIGIIGRKHVNVRRANEVFGEFLETPLRKKDEDKADAMLLAVAYHLRRIKANE